MKNSATTDKRAYRRFLAKKGAMAFYNGVELFGNIKDISLGGLSFCVVKPNHELDTNSSIVKRGLVELIYGKKDFTLNNVKVDIVSNCQTEINLTPNRIKKVYRASIKFIELTDDELFLIKRFLVTCTSCSRCYHWAN